MKPTNQPTNQLVLSKFKQVSGETVIVGDFSLKRNLNRGSGLELLRIIAMVLIVMHHVWYQNTIDISNIWDKRLILAFGFGGKLGVNIFVLISAYFMVNKSFKLSRILNFVIRATFYSVVIYFLFIISGIIQFKWVDFIKSVFPVFYDVWWFVTAFTLLMFISPVLNLILHNADSKKLGLSILCLVVFTVIFPYANRVLIEYFYQVPYFNELFVFIELYLVGGYIKLYDVRIRKKWIILFTFVVLLYQIVVTAMGRMGGIEYQLCSFGNVFGAIGLFMIFKGFKFQSRMINIISSTTFGIYLLHENPYIRGWIYQYLHQYLFSSINSPIILFWLLTVTVFVGCMVVDLICLQTVHRLTNRFLKWVDRKIASKK